jgi:NAD(P) transhydrogenase subunit alpha
MIVPCMPLLLADAAAAADPATTFIRLLTVFLLAMWVGFEVITKVPQRLHTPLTSGSNAISGITAVGAIVVAGALATRFGSFLGFVAVILAMINVVGGFVVTHRMLAMFQPKKK